MQRSGGGESGNLAEKAGSCSRVTLNFYFRAERGIRPGSLWTREKIRLHQGLKYRDSTRTIGGQQVDWVCGPGRLWKRDAQELWEPCQRKSQGGAGNT